MFSALPSTTDISAALCQPRAQSCSFRPPRWVFSFKKLELLRVNEPHRSAANESQRFDHPPPSSGWLNVKLKCFFSTGIRFMVELRQNSGNGQSAGPLHRPVSLKARDHPIDKHHDGAGQKYGARHGHGGADRSLVRLAYDHMEKETSRLSQDADKERRARRVLDHK